MKIFRYNCCMKKFLIADDSPSWVRHHSFCVKQVFEDANIITAYSAKEGDFALSANIDEPFDFILTDMQMETDYLPLNAGEWLIKQAQFYPEYKNTRIIIISASPQIEQIAKKYGVDFIPKKLCQTTVPYFEKFSNQ